MLLDLLEIKMHLEKRWLIIMILEFIVGFIVLWIVIEVILVQIRISLSILLCFLPFILGIIAVGLLFAFPPLGIFLLVLVAANCIGKENGNNDANKKTETKPGCAYCGGAVEKWAETKYSHNGHKFCSPYCYEKFQEKH